MLKTNGENGLMTFWKRQSIITNITQPGIAVVLATPSGRMPLLQRLVRIFHPPYPPLPFHHRAAVRRAGVGVDFVVVEVVGGDVLVVEVVEAEVAAGNPWSAQLINWIASLDWRERYFHPIAKFPLIF